MTVDYLLVSTGSLPMSEVANAAILYLVIILSLIVVVNWYRKRRIPSASSLALLAVAVAVWSLAYLLPSRVDQFSPVLRISIIHFGVTVSASAFLTFSLAYSNRSSWLTRTAFILLSIMPLVTQLVLWVEPWRNLLYMTPVLLSNGLVLEGGIWPGLVFLYVYNLELISILLLINTFILKPRQHLFQSTSILWGSFAPWLFQLLGHVGGLPAGRFEFLHLGFSVSLLGFANAIYRGRAVEIVPLTRDAVVEGMSDGWMVLDGDNKIIDINPAAETIVGSSRSKVYGKPVNTVLTDFPGLSDAAGGAKEIDMRRSIRTKTDWRYLNIRLSNLRDRDQSALGKLILWRDITERRLADDARQRARDEMFAILNAISNAAAHSATVEDFLAEALNQIIYPFDSQVAAIYLIDEENTEVDSTQLYLASQFGLTPEAKQSLTEVRVASSLFDLVVNQKRNLLMDDLTNEVRIRYDVRGLGISNFLLIPMTTHAEGENKIIGCLALARKEQNLYSQDEIVRLTSIADQIATMVDSDRRRQLSIARLERQRLLRDLHDSVSQKLYGLVTLTEAAQAALEAGSSVVPSDVLKKIGDNARLAVKEMRLFLYEMQPVDLGKEGLVSVLHHRLAAVEGRADIKARLLADENIILTKEKEIALYYVAQEALNNILKHAHAKSVSVMLRQTRQNVILEVMDDGRGFDLKKVEPGGLGLKNMKERITLIDGKLKLESKVGGGTTIKVTVGKDRNSVKNRLQEKS